MTIKAVAFGIHAGGNSFFVRKSFLYTGNSCVIHKKFLVYQKLLLLWLKVSSTLETLALFFVSSFTPKAAAF